MRKRGGGAISTTLYMYVLLLGNLNRILHEHMPYKDYVTWTYEEVEGSIKRVIMNKLIIRGISIWHIPKVHNNFLLKAADTQCTRMSNNQLVLLFRSMLLIEMSANHFLLSDFVCKRIPFGCNIRYVWYLNLHEPLTYLMRQFFTCIIHW